MQQVHSPIKSAIVLEMFNLTLNTSNIFKHTSLEKLAEQLLYLIFSYSRAEVRIHLQLQMQPRDGLASREAVLVLPELPPVPLPGYTIIKRSNRFIPL